MYTKCEHLILLSLVMVAIAAPAFSDPVFVDCTYEGIGMGTPENPYKTINEGVLNAASGDTVIVRPGVYLENVTIVAARRPAR